MPYRDIENEEPKLLNADVVTQKEVPEQDRKKLKPKR